MDRKAPPQAVAEVHRKLPAASLPLDAPAQPAKRSKSNTGVGHAAAAAGAAEVIDVASEMHFQRGDCLEVKWTINDDDDSHGEGQHDSEVNMKATNEDGGPKDITVWWAATLCEKTEKMHTLTPREERKDVQIPIYTLNYAPLEELGFETHSLEDVAFISNRTLLNLSTNEMMTFRKRGEPSPPPSPTPQEAVKAREFASPDEMGSFMNHLMQQCLKSTGMDEKMDSMPAAERLLVAERITRAKEGFLARMMEETGKMEAGKKVVTAEVVNRCMAQMKGAY